MLSTSLPALASPGHTGRLRHGTGLGSASKPLQLLESCDVGGQPRLPGHHVRRLQLVMQHIEANLHADLSLERLADLAAFSPFHFHRLFRAWAGETTKAFVRRRRLETAAIRLRHGPEGRVGTICVSCGFASSEAFARAFREHFGMTPSQWRDEHRGDTDGYGHAGVACARQIAP
jgi:AraC-like DNA-binding protein